MRRIGFALVISLAFSVPLAGALATTLDYQGYAYETGGFPPSAPGDTLFFPFIVTASSADLGIDPVAEELTGWIDGLVANGPQDAGEGVEFYTFSDGRIEVWRDVSQDHDFGVLPPNATVPASFRNGTLCLAGTLRNFVLYIDTETGTGAYEGNVFFDTGACLATLDAASAEGYTFGGALTRAFLGDGALPDGYGMQLDGFLEAQKKPLVLCPFECMGIESARLDFPRRPSGRFSSRDGKFRIGGVFLECLEGGILDPALSEVRVRIGEYVQVFPEGALRLEDEDEDGEAKWEFENPSGTGTINELEIERESNGTWEFEIRGRGIPRTTLLGDGRVLEVELEIGTSSGIATATLVQKKHHLRYKSCRTPCRRQHAPEAGLPFPVAAAEPGAALFGATPNPFNATTVISLRTTSPGQAQLRIFDVRGRLVRALQNGTLPAGEHHFVWNGLDEAGRAVPSGVYLYRIEAPGIAASRKLVVAK